MKLYIVSFLLTCMYFLSSIQKVKGFNDTSISFQKMTGNKLLKIPLSLSKLLIICAILIELLCPIILFYSIYKIQNSHDKMTIHKYKTYAYYSLLLLVLFTILATYIYHYPPNGDEYYPFMKNITIIGGLLAMTLHFHKI
jgi:uncharacterized membrane protein YphA (DoxX/SURF4 family)